MGDMAAIKVLKKRPIFYNGIFRCHGNICYVTFIDVCFCNVYIGPINMCTNFYINRYNIDEFRKRYVVRHSAVTLPMDIFIMNIFQSTRSLYDFRYNSYDTNVFGVFVFGDLDLDLDLYSTFYKHTNTHTNTQIYSE